MRSLTRRHLLHLGASSLTLSTAKALGGGALAAGLVGCGATTQWSGVDASSGQRIVVRAGTMPFGGTFTGSYRSPVCGGLTLIQRGRRLDGSYRRYDDPDAIGSLAGRVTGNLAEFRWAEYKLPDRDCPDLQGTGFFLLDQSAFADVGAQLFGRRTFFVSGKGPAEGAHEGGEGDLGTTTRDGGPWTAVRIA